jgi:hypothetical protein
MMKLIPFAAVLGAASTLAAAPPALRQATFDVRQEFTIAAAEGAKKLRAWLTMPQNDPNQTVGHLKIHRAEVTKLHVSSATDCRRGWRRSPPTAW